MTQLIIHYNDGNRKEDLYFTITSQKDMIDILMREMSPEKLWVRGWDKKYCWNEVR